MGRSVWVRPSPSTLARRVRHLPSSPAEPPVRTGSVPTVLVRAESAGPQPEGATGVFSKPGFPIWTPFRRRDGGEVPASSMTTLRVQAAGRGLALGQAD